MAEQSRPCHRKRARLPTHQANASRAGTSDIVQRSHLHKGLDGSCSELSRGPRRNLERGAQRQSMIRHRARIRIVALDHVQTVHREVLRLSLATFLRSNTPLVRELAAISKRARHRSQEVRAKRKYTVRLAKMIDSVHGF